MLQHILCCWRPTYDTFDNYSAQMLARQESLSKMRCTCLRLCFFPLAGSGFPSSWKWSWVESDNLCLNNLKQTRADQDKAQNPIHVNHCWMSRPGLMDHKAQAIYHTSNAYFKPWKISSAYINRPGANSLRLALLCTLNQHGLGGLRCGASRIQTFHTKSCKLGGHIAKHCDTCVI